MENFSRQAKQSKLRLWKNYTQVTSNSDETSRNLNGKVVEVLNGDGIVIKLADGSVKKIFLSSIRPPRFNFK
jgi:staphylococcal nuclease domain-containing protein 1